MNTWNVALPASHNEAETGGPLGSCIECFTCSARVYLEWTKLVTGCFYCVLDCGGLLRPSDSELKSWGVRSDEEQFGRFKGECGDLTAAEERARKRAAQRRELKKMRAAAAEPPPHMGAAPLQRPNRV